MLNQNDTVNKGDRNKIYFLVVVIAALLGTNAYLFFKDKQENARYVSITTEKDRLQLEVEKIEVELDKLNDLNVQLSDKLVTEQSQAREKIAELKASLQKAELTKEELENVQRQVRDLRDFVRQHNERIILLERENAALKNEVDVLKETASLAEQQAKSLAEKNSELNAKVRASSALKASGISVTAYRVKSNGRNIEVSKASTAKKLSVTFSIVPNPLAEKNYHKIYLRVFDPAGNLIANENNMFEAEGEEMQYSSSTSISYNDDNTAYTMDWVNPNPFMKGTYTVIIYSDGYAMGRSEIELR
jgi:DNA repair exonuclease SbcCD ATPase subunit